MIYLDNSATTKPYDEVIDSYVKVATNFFGNPSSIHGLGIKAENLISQSRNQIANLLHVSPQEIIFTSGGSEGNNLAIKGSALYHKNRGKHIITTSIEHPSITESCEQLKKLGFTITYLPVNDDGFISVEDLKQAICDETILVSIMQVNNEIGTIQPIEEIGEFLKGYPKITFHVDAVQGLGKVPLELNGSGIDICTYSGHKIHGVKGIGFMYIRKGIQLSPLISGGAQELQYRSGTENVAGIVSLAKAVRLTLEEQQQKVSSMEAIKQQLYRELQEINFISINTPLVNSAPHIINFSINGMKSEVFVHLLEEEGIYVSTTSACSSKKKAPSKTLLAMGKSKELAGSPIRISLSNDNRVDEVPIIITTIKKSIEKLAKVMR